MNSDKRSHQNIRRFAVLQTAELLEHLLGLIMGTVSCRRIQQTPAVHSYATTSDYSPINKK
jgi:hypothetical protein